MFTTLIKQLELCRAHTPHALQLASLDMLSDFAMMTPTYTELEHAQSELIGCE